MEKENLSDEQTRLIEQAQLLSEAITKTIYEMIGKGFNFNLFIYNDQFATFTGDGDISEGIEKIKQVIACHEGTCNHAKEPATTH